MATVTSPTSAVNGNYQSPIVATNISFPAYSSPNNSSGVASWATLKYVLQSGASCVRQKPFVLLSPDKAPAVSAGTTVPYAVTVINRDSSACGASTFNLANFTEVPSGWTESYSPTALSIPVAGFATSTLSVTSAATAAAGNYYVQTTATNSASPSYVGFDAAVYEVASSGGTTSPPQSLAVKVAPNTATYTRGSVATITATVSSGGSPVSGAAVTFTITAPNGKVSTKTATSGANGQALMSFTIRKGAATGTYQVKATAGSGAQTASGSTSFNVQ